MNFRRATADVPVRPAKRRKTREECGETIKKTAEIFSSGRNLNGGTARVRNLDL